jgi:hypothetical protein
VRFTLAAVCDRRNEAGATLTLAYETFRTFTALIERRYT